MKVLKVLHVIAGMNPELGGVCQAVKTISKTLSNAGISSEIVSLDEPDAIYIRTSSFTIHAIGTGKGPWKFNIALKKWLHLNVLQFNVVIVHGLWLYHGYAVKNILDSFKKNQQPVPKLLVMPHGMLDPYFQLAAARKFKAIRNSIFWYFVERKLIAAADALLFTCKKEMDLASATFKFYQPKCALVVGLGVENPPDYDGRMLQIFRNKTSLTDKEPYLLFLGRLEEKKGIDMLIAAYISLNKKVANLPALVIAGPGIESNYGQQLKILAAQHTKIQFINMLVDEAKWGAFYGCEVFILPSHQENFGLAVAEALACAKPVLITNQINICREIEQSAAGLVNKDTAAGIELMLTAWVNLPIQKQQAMGVAAKNCFHKFFAMDVFSKILIEAISTI